jgi:hypothetical protein
MDRTLQSSMGNAAFEFCTKNFDSSSHVEKVENCYEEILRYQKEINAK